MCFVNDASWRIVNTQSENPASGMRITSGYFRLEPEWFRWLLKPPVGNKSFLEEEEKKITVEMVRAKYFLKKRVLNRTSGPRTIW